MKQTTLLVLTILLFISCKKDKDEPQPTPETTPTYFTFSGRIGINDNSTLISSDSSIIICGNSSSYITVLKISKTGTQIWRNDFTAGNNSEAASIVETSNNDFLICGHTSRNYPNSNWDFLLIKINSIGDTLWTKTYGTFEEDYGYQIIKTDDDNYLLSGVTYKDTTTSFCDILLIKVNSNGDTLWTRSYPDPDQEVPFHLMETLNGEYLVTGTNEDEDQGRELYLLKTDVNGNKLWDRKIGSVWRWGYSTVELSNGDLLTCGKQYDPFGYAQVMLIKTDNSGTKIWEKEYGSSTLSEEGNSIKINLDGSYTITGSSYDVSTMRDDIILLKVDINGNQLWINKFGGSDTDWGINLIKDYNDDNIITGTTYNYGSNASNGNIFMTKTDSNGNFK